MAPSKPAHDLNAMIAAGKNSSRSTIKKGLGVANSLPDRQRRKNENLAQEIFGKNRRSSAPGAGMNSRKPSAVVPSLASRIGSPGITKV
jgi:hypothetical protein